MSEDNIKGLINEDVWNKYIDKNDDAYGGACVQVARNVMKHLDDYEGEFNIGYNPDMTTPHGIICAADDSGGITGFMAGAVRNMVAQCHKLGWKFYIADLLNKYNIDDESKEDREKFIKNISDGDLQLCTEEEAREYMEGVIARYHDVKDQELAEAPGEAEDAIDEDE
jgi:hypothetical protein